MAGRKSAPVTTDPTAPWAHDLAALKAELTSRLTLLDEAVADVEAEVGDLESRIELLEGQAGESGSEDD